MNGEALAADPRLKVATVVHDGISGYTTECAIPWSLVDVSFRPEKGMLIGMDLNITHRIKGDKNVLRWSVFNWSSHEKDPATWGTALFK